MDWVVIGKAAKALDEMPKLIWDIASSCDHRPFPDSQASQELNDCQNNKLLEPAYCQGAQQVFISSDHMSGLRRVLMSSPTVLSCVPWTCGRAVLESCSTGAWLFDIDIDSKERITRSMNLRLEDQNRIMNLARNDQEHFPELSNHKDDRLIEKAKTRIMYLRGQAKELGLDEKKNKRGKFIGFGSGLPTISNRIASIFNAKWEYTMLSAAAHGNSYTFFGLSTQREQTKDGPILKPYLKPYHALYLISRVVEWSASTAWTQFSLFGWDLNKLQAIMENEYNRIGINKEMRFWR